MLSFFKIMNFKVNSFVNFQDKATTTIDLSGDFVKNRVINYMNKIRFIVHSEIKSALIGEKT